MSTTGLGSPIYSPKLVVDAVGAITPGEKTCCGMPTFRGVRKRSPDQEMKMPYILRCCSFANSKLHVTEDPPPPEQIMVVLIRGGERERERDLRTKLEEKKNPRTGTRDRRHTGGRAPRDFLMPDNPLASERASEP